MAYRKFKGWMVLHNDLVILLYFLIFECWMYSKYQRLYVPDSHPLIANFKKQSEINVASYSVHLHREITKVEKYYQHVKPRKQYVFPRFVTHEHMDVDDRHDVFRCADDDGITFNASLRDYQHDICKMIHDKIIHDKGTLLCMPPGQGKTVIALHICSTLKPQHVVIIVNTKELRDQWLARIKQFLTLDPEKVKISVVMIQTASRKTFMRQRKVDMVIIDEVHHLCAKTLCNALFKFNAPYILGLTATVIRKDNRTNLLFRLIGKIGYYLRIPYSLPINLYALSYEHEHQSSNKRRKLSEIKDISMSTTGCNYQQMINDLCDDTQRSDAMLRCVRHELRETFKKRTILILCARLASMEYVYEYTTKHWSDCKKIHVLDKQRKQSVDRDEATVLIGTDQKVSENFDMPRIDTLVRMLPTCEDEQTYGRAMRQHDKKILPVCIFEYKDKGYDARTKMIRSNDVRMSIRNTKDSWKFNSEFQSLLQSKQYDFRFTDKEIKVCVLK